MVSGEATGGDGELAHGGILARRILEDLDDVGGRARPEGEVVDSGLEPRVVVLSVVGPLLEDEAVAGEQELEAPRGGVAVELEQVAVPRVVLDLHPGSHRERSGSAGQVPGVSPAGCAAALLLPEVQVEARLVPRQPHVEQRRRALGREVGEQVAGAAAKLVLTAVRVALPEADLPARLPRRRPSAALVHGGHALERCLAEGAARAEQVRVPSRLVKGEERRRRAHRRRRRARHKRVIVHVDHELEVGKLVRVCQLLEVVHKRYEHRRARPARRAKPPDGAVDNGKRGADGAVWQQASCLVEELRRDGAKPMQVALELRDEWPNRLGAEPSRRERLRLWPGSLHAARQSVKTGDLLELSRALELCPKSCPKSCPKGRGAS
mmetsp:Transcript_50750/g.168090  ORF Transcript_50750/g.168090 Transcript_50750/m.168090 type:complete len:380 (-) Transcript_50750:50-1189(-)